MVILVDPAAKAIHSVLLGTPVPLHNGEGPLGFPLGGKVEQKPSTSPLQKKVAEPQSGPAGAGKSHCA